MAKHISHKTPREKYYEQLVELTANKFIELYYNDEHLYMKHTEDNDEETNKNTDL
jgi:hypothetical protein